MTGFVRKNLAQLVSEADLEIDFPGSATEIEITGIVLDSRQVEPGNLFVALSGGITDGHRFIPAAIERGAAAVMGSAEITDLPVPYLRVVDGREALASLSAAFYGFPARRMTIIGVTGTDGKTTTSNMIYQILVKAGLWAGIISTINAVIGDDLVDTGFHVTTPEAPDIQRYLARMKAAGLTHVVLETTSHGLAQNRVTGCEYDIAVVTNITHEHLDFHGSYDAYREVKGRLFRMLAETGPKERGNIRLGVINADDQSYEYICEVTKTPIVTYSQKPEMADYWAEEIYHDAAGLHYTAVGPGFRVPVECPLVGTYNVSNSLAAMAAVVSGLSITPEVAAEGIASLQSIPGRMERIDMGQPFLAIVDFAHTPNALKQALQTARAMTQGKVITVFGSAGLRDRDKRRMMAKTALELADYTLLTAEDPRTESLDAILEEMAAAACSKGGEEGRNFWRVADRGDAIYRAIELAQAGDVVIACGKGHEQSMCFGTTEYPWDDRTAVRAALARRLAATGPGMPYLPTQDQ